MTPRMMREKIMRGFCLLLVLTGCGEQRSPRSAELLDGEDLLPTFEVEENPRPDFSGEQTSGVSKRPEPNVKQFQVLIFPHEGKYTTPQGREKVTTSAEVTSKSGCTRYAAEKNADQEWVKNGDALGTETRILLSASGTEESAAYYFVCTDEFKVSRGASFEAFTYPGNFVALITPNTLRIVNLVEPETYVKGVVPSEVYTSWPAEVLKAQAVAARTYAWWTVRNARYGTVKEYDIDDTIGYQAYTGVSKRVKKTDDAVEDTLKTVIKDTNGYIIKAYFSADSGGFTADAQEAFGGAPASYCKAKKELYDLSKYNSSWTKTYDLDDVSAALVKAGAIPKETQLASLAIASRDSSGRVKLMTGKDQNGKTVKITGARLLNTLSLRSRLFDLMISEINLNGTISVENKAMTLFQLVINGNGYGHGVGMSQVGALQYVQQMNWTFEQILKFYYTDVALTSVNE